MPSPITEDKYIYITERDPFKQVSKCSFRFIKFLSNLQKGRNLVRRPWKETLLVGIGWILNSFEKLQVNFVETREGVLGDLLPVLGGEEEPGGGQQQDVWG